MDNEEKVEAKAAKETATLEEEARKLGVKRSKVSMGGFNVKDKTPDKAAKEEYRHKILADRRLKARVAKAKAVAKMKPIEKRKVLLIGRFKAIRARVRAHTYSDKNIEAWREEYELIINNPKRWIRITENGKKPYTPGNKRKKSAKEQLDSMNLDDENEDS